MLDRLTLRQRVVVYFMFMAAAVIALLGGAGYVILERIPESAVAPLVLYGGGAGFVIVSTIVWT